MSKFKQDIEISYKNKNSYCVLKNILKVGLTEVDVVISTL